MYIRKIMKLLIIFFVFNVVIITKTEISKSLKEYIETKKRLQKYSVTMLVDYTRNQQSFIEENLYFNWKDMISFHNKSYFKDKILNVTIFQRNNYEFDCKIKRTENHTIVEGYSVEILKLLQYVLQFKVRYNIVQNLRQKENNSLEENLLNNTTDLILCHPNVRNNTQTDVLHPTLKSSYVVVYDPAKLSFTKDIFILTFAGTLWLCFIIVLILLAIVLRIFTKQYKKIYGYPEWDTVEITFWAIATACQQGLSSTPYGFGSRAIIFLGAITAYLLYTGFAAGITSLVAVQNQNFELSVTEIERMRLNVVSFGNILDLPEKYNYLKTSVEVDNLEEFFESLNKKHWIGVSLEILLNQYFTSKNKINDYCLYTMVALRDSQIAMSMLVPKNSNLKSVFNYWLIRMQEDGITNVTLFRNKTSLNGCATTTGFSSAKLEHVKSAIGVLIVGLVASLVFLMGECIWNGYKHRKQKSRATVIT